MFKNWFIVQFKPNAHMAAEETLEYKVLKLSFLWKNSQKEKG